MDECILLLTNNDDDVYCFRLELLRALLAAGFRLVISCPDGPKFEQMEREGLRRGIEYQYDDPPIDRRGTNVLHDLKLLLHYHSVLKRYQPSVILTYTAKPNIYAGLAARQLGIPVISNMTGLGSVIREAGAKQKLILWLFRLAFRSSACVMFQNAANCDMALRLGWVKGRHRLIPGSGVALDRFPLLPYPDGGDGKSGAVIVFNYIGRILKDKGVDDYIEAAKRIRSKYRNTEFNLIGFIEPTESHYEAELKTLEQNGVVFYRGSQIDVRPWIRRSHCIIHPSVYGEGMSNVLLENAASGRPIITTDIPGCREAVENGVTGFTYPGGAVDVLVDHIERFLTVLTNEERKEMGIRGREKVSREFDRDLVIDAYLQEVSAYRRE